MEGGLVPVVVGGEDDGLGVVVHTDDEGPPLQLGSGGGKGEGGVEEEEQRENQREEMVKDEGRHG